MSAARRADEDGRMVLFLIFMTDFVMPSWTDLRACHTESSVIYDGVVSRLPRPELRTPGWVRPLQRKYDVGRVLVGFRMLLTHEAQFVDKHIDYLPSPRSGGELVTDLALIALEVD